MKGWTRSLGKLELTFGKNAVWEMVSSNNLAKGNDGNYAANLTKLALDDAHVYSERLPVPGIFISARIWKKIFRTVCT